MKKHFDRLSDEYNRRFSAAGFQSAEDFKKEFFRKARQLPPPHKSLLFKPAVWIGAAAAMVILGFAVFYHIHNASTGTSLLAEARRMFEPDGQGVALVNGELITFDRASRKPVDSLFELELKQGKTGRPIKVQFAAANGDLIRIDSPWLKGEFWVYKVDKGLYALESNCRVKGLNGKDMQFAELTPVAVNTAQTEKNDRFSVTRKVMPL